MLMKPSMLDYRYNGLDMNELRREYERDLMLYEQTKALQKMANTSDFRFDVNELSMYDLEFEGSDLEVEYKYEKYCNLQKRKDEIKSYISTVESINNTHILVGILLILLEICNIPVPVIPHWAAFLLILFIPLLVKAIHENKLRKLKILYADTCKEIRKLEAESRKVKKNR